MKRRTRRKTTALVPRAVFRTMFAGVVPVCVAGACGGTTIVNSGDASTSDASSDQSQQDELQLGVAACCFEAGVADAGFADATDGSSDSKDAAEDDRFIAAVACCGFDGSDL